MRNPRSPRRLNDSSWGRLLMTIFDIIMLTLFKLWFWFAEIRSPHKWTILVLLVFVGFWLQSDDSKSTSKEAYRETAVPIAIAAEIPAVTSPSRVLRPIEYNTGDLAGRSAADLYASYMGYEGSIIPTTLTISWQDQLEHLWERKYQRRDITNPAREVGSALLTEYATEDPGYMSLVDYQVAAARQADAICTRLNWDGLRRRYDLSVREGALLERLACNMGGRTLLAYSMTELLPSSAGNLNRQYLDFLLQNAGRRYVESLPAVHDGYASFGSFQFTQFAIYDTATEQRGASRVNRYLPADLRIPGSTVGLRGDDHFRAAYLFAIHNLAVGIDGLSRRQVATLEAVGGQQGIELAQYLAVAHNKPANGRRYLRSWLNAGGRGSFIDHCQNRASRLYAEKTRNNYNALSPTREM